MSGFRIPFNKPCFTGDEMRFIAEAVRNGHCAGDGEFTKRCQALLEQELGVPKVLLTTSCTHALEMAALLLDIRPGDEVIVPSFTFVSTVNAFVLRGARPVFVDIRPDTLNMDERQLERPDHAAHARDRGGALRRRRLRDGRDSTTSPPDTASRWWRTTRTGCSAATTAGMLGTFGCLATQSFHETKNIHLRRGRRAADQRSRDGSSGPRSCARKGPTAAAFFRGQVDKYTWVDVGSSYVLSDVLAAFLLAQLEAREEIQSTRRRIWERYHEHLHDWAEERGVRLPVMPSQCEQSYHMFYMLLPSLALRDGLIEHLRQRRILSVFHYLPLHTSDMGRRFGGRPGDCPVTEDVSDRLLRLPFYNDLTEEDQMAVIEAVRGAA